MVPFFWNIYKADIQSFKAKAAHTIIILGSQGVHATGPPQRLHCKGTPGDETECPALRDPTVTSKHSNLSGDWGLATITYLFPLAGFFSWMN